MASFSTALVISEISALKQTQVKCELSIFIPLKFGFDFGLLYRQS